MERTYLNLDCMDAERGLPSYPDKYFDLAIVDPPYGLGEKLTKGGTWAAKHSKNDASWDIAPIQNYWDQLFRVSTNQIIWGGNYFGLPPSRCFIIWDKVAHMDTLADCEYAWTSFDRNAKIFRHVRNTKETRIHICQKPEELYRWLLKNYAKQGMKLLDTHVGSASSLVAFEEMGFEYVAFEKDPDYYRDSCKRLEAHRKQQSLFTGQEIFKASGGQSTLF